MKILITALHPVGGIRTYFRYVYSQQNFTDDELVFLCPNSDIEDFIKNYIKHEKVEVVLVKSKFQYFIKLRELLKCNYYDLVHAHGFSSGVFVSLANYFTNSKSILTGHDVFSQGLFSGVKGKVKYNILKWVFSQYDLINTISNDTEKNFKEYYPSINENKFRTIRNGIDTDFFLRGDANNLKEQLLIDDKQLLIGFFGRFMAQKGFRVLVDAIKEIVGRGLLKHPLKVATFGWGGFIREDYQYIKELGLSEYFIQMDSTDDMPGNLKGVDIVVMPSKWEACPLLPMEALSAGTPIIGTNCIGLNEILEGTPAIKTPVGDVESLISAIVQFTNEPTIKSDTLAFQKTAVKAFRVSNTSTELKKVYCELLVL
jgi:glycosyltransferase involved in cell wall biosynthesis